MIDIHAHILPGLDDGAASVDDALEMAALALRSGVRMLAATPHATAWGGGRNLWGPELHRVVSGFQELLRDAGLNLRILPGMEIMGSPQVPELLKAKKLIGLAGSIHPLIEFPFVDYGGRATELLERLIADGWQPVVAHPERYEYVLEDPAVLNLWVRMGCLLQVNKGSLLGAFGPAEERLALELVDRGFAFAVASDAHSPLRRTPWMEDTARLLEAEFSPQAALALLSRNPGRLLTNEFIREEEPFWFR